MTNLFIPHITYIPKERRVTKLTIIAGFPFRRFQPFRVHVPANQRTVVIGRKKPFRTASVAETCQLATVRTAMPTLSVLCNDALDFLVIRPFLNLSTSQAATISLLN